MVLCVGCGSCVSLFGERERAAKCPGRREACERARRCARRTRGEGERSTDVLRVHQEELQLGLLVSEFERRRVTFRRRERGRAWRHAHRSPRGRAARGEFLPWTVPLRVTPLRSNSTGRTHASTRLRRRAHLARSAKGPHKTQPWCVHGRRARVRSGGLATRLGRSGRVASSRARAHRPNDRIDRTSPAREPSRPRPRRRRVAKRATDRSVSAASRVRAFLGFFSLATISRSRNPYDSPLLRRSLKNHPIRRPATAACTSLCSPRWTKS